MAKYGGGFGGGMNMQAMMQQAKKLQEQMAAAEAELEDTELTGEAGSGLVSVTIDGKKRLQRLSIKPEAVDMDDLEMLEDLIMAAYNEAFAAAEELEQELMPAGVGAMGGMLK